MDEAAPAEAGTAAEKKRPLLRRIPTSLIVTLVGIALTAWLLPAFTRQWDDRQKAQEIKAAVASQIATATAQALIRSDEEIKRRVNAPPPNGVPDAANRSLGLGEASPVGIARETRLDDLWLSDEVKIEAKVRAYFGSSQLVAALASYTHTMRVLFSIAAQAYAVRWDPFLSDSLGAISLRTLADSLGVALQEFKGDLRFLGNPFRRSTLVERAVLRQLTFASVASGVLAKENQLIDAIGAAHPDGYSTTYRDLIHDLFP